LRRIERETGVRRETAAGYLRAAGIAVRYPGGWGRQPPGPSDSKPANEVIPDSVSDGGATNEVIADLNPKPAIHDRYLSRTNGVVLATPPDGEFISRRFLKGRALCRLIGERIYISAVPFSAPSLCIVLGSTAKRDQSFICAYPAF
jgi:hypothetical protein